MIKIWRHTGMMRRIGGEGWGMTFEMSERIVLIILAASFVCKKLMSSIKWRILLKKREVKKFAEEEELLEEGEVFWRETPLLKNCEGLSLGSQKVLWCASISKPGERSWAPAIWNYLKKKICLVNCVDGRLFEELLCRLEILWGRFIWELTASA